MVFIKIKVEDILRLIFFFCFFFFSCLLDNWANGFWSSSGYSFGAGSKAFGYLGSDSGVSPEVFVESSEPQLEVSLLTLSDFGEYR